jgi:polysaccharide deacetylase family protein (PEP-CTERM system associated)
MNAISIDVEDWYHCLDQDPANWDGYEDRIAGSVRGILEIFERASTKATFFVLGHVARRHPELVEEIHRAGHEVASHGTDHRFVYRQTPDEFERDVARSVELLTDVTGQPVHGYRAPYFSITRQSLWALAVLRKLGFVYDSSIFPVVNHRYGIPDARRLVHETESGVIEVPLSTDRVGGVNLPCSGGVYFRVLPYRLVVAMLRRLQRHGEPIVFYLHPWEIDAGQPRIPLPRALRARHYAGLDRCGPKLARLLREFRFGPIRQMLNL